MKGQVYVLTEKGQLNAGQLHQLSLSEKDLHEGLHEHGNLGSPAETAAVYLARHGSSGVVRQEKPAGETLT